MNITSCGMKHTSAREIIYQYQYREDLPTSATPSLEALLEISI